MTKRELVKAAIAHKKTPRIPYCIRATGEMDAKLTAALGMGVESFADNDVDCVQPPWWTWDKLAGDWSGFDRPVTKASVRGTGNYEDFSAKIKESKNSCDKYVLAMVYGSHFEKAYFSRGIENFLADMAGDADFAKKLLSKIIDKNMVMLENFLNISEIDGVLLGSDWGSQQGLLMSPESWDELIRPGEQREYDLIHSYGKDVWIHSCGRIDAVIPRLIEMGVDVLNPIQPECMDVSRLKTDFGGRITFWGGLSTQRTLPYGSPEDVAKEARRLKKEMSQGGGYIFAPAQELQADVPVENFTALVAAAKE